MNNLPRKICNTFRELVIQALVKNGTNEILNICNVKGPVYDQFWVKETPLFCNLRKEGASHVVRNTRVKHTYLKKICCSKINRTFAFA